MHKYVPFVLIVCGGCASPSYNYQPQYTNISEPPLNTTTVAYVGDNMIRQGKYSEQDAIYLPQNIDISWSYTLHAGYYLKKGEDNNSETYLPSGASDSGLIQKAALADPPQALMLYKDKNRICVVTAFNGIVCENDVNYQKKKKPTMNDDSFQQTLIYNGKVGEKVNIGYREFSNNTARPSFNNDVEYDLSSSNVIGYKGARIEIEEATNQQIKYKVISNFNTNQSP